MLTSSLPRPVSNMQRELMGLRTGRRTTERRGPLGTRRSERAAAADTDAERKAAAPQIGHLSGRRHIGRGPVSRLGRPPPARRQLFGGAVAGGGRIMFEGALTTDGEHRLALAIVRRACCVGSRRVASGPKAHRACGVGRRRRHQVGGLAAAARRHGAARVRGGR
jgi:hypothetical protein